MTTNWRQAAQALRESGALPDAAALIAASIDGDDKPAWVARVLSQLTPPRALQEEHEWLIATCNDREDWPKASALFRDLRVKTKAAERLGTAEPHLYLLESACKIVANSGGAAFDKDSEEWFALLALESAANEGPASAEKAWSALLL